MRLNNLSKFFIVYSEDLKEAMLTLGGAFFFIMLLWGATEAYDWAVQIIHENQMLKVERQIESSQLYVRLTVDRAAERRKEVEREAAIRIAKLTPWKKRILEAK